MNVSNKNLFISLFNQKKENFLTESLSYFLINSLKSDNELIDRFLALLDYKSSEVKVIAIETQKHFPKNNSFIDLVITLDTNELLLIEVKYESNLNEYEIESKQEKVTINQLEKYSKIDVKKRLYLLSIDDYSDYSKIADFNKNHIYWYQIYEIFNSLKNKSSTTKEFIEFMNNIGNKLPKIQFDIQQSTQTVFALLLLLERAIKKKGLFKKNTSFSGTTGYLGFYIYPSEPTARNNFISNNSQNFVWVGFSVKHPNQLTFQISDKRFIDEDNREKISTFIKDGDILDRHKGEIRLSPLVFEESFYKNESIEQFSRIEKWIIKKDEVLNELYTNLF